jgi:hypothetical protein
MFFFFGGVNPHCNAIVNNTNEGGLTFVNILPEMIRLLAFQSIL